ncbi:hypothetical protein BDR26DRAFT_900341 [Obelidium mucronatum]|nr:hypothetical protein BDR26DRAFT_900341 [Obelidium mucronatum]
MSSSTLGFDPYEVLGVSRTATQSDIKRAYHRVSRQLHPDKRQLASDWLVFQGGSTAQMARANQANDVLGDPEKRRAHDRATANYAGAPSHAHAGAYEPTFDDMLRHFMFAQFAREFHGYGGEDDECEEEYEGEYEDEGECEDDDGEEYLDSIDVDEVLADIPEDIGDAAFVGAFRDALDASAREVLGFKMPQPPRNLACHRHPEGRWCFDWNEATDDPISVYPIAYRIEIKQGVLPWSRVWSGVGTAFSIGIPFHTTVECRIRTISVQGHSRFATFPKLTGNQMESDCQPAGASTTKAPSSQPGTSSRPKPDPKPEPIPNPKPEPVKSFKVTSRILDDLSSPLKPNYKTEVTFIWELASTTTSTKVNVTKIHILQRKRGSNDAGFSSCWSGPSINTKATIQFENEWGIYEFAIKVFLDFIFFMYNTPPPPFNLSC